MAFLKAFLSLTVLSITTLQQVLASAAAFSGNLHLYDLCVSNPIEINKNTTDNSTVSFTVVDDDYPELTPVTCAISWLPGTNPPDKPQHQCSNDTMHVWFPNGTFNGVSNFQMDFSHTVIDEDLGPCPQYCVLSKFATLNVTYPGLQGYECDLPTAICESSTGTRIAAPVTTIVG